THQTSNIIHQTSIIFRPPFSSAPASPVLLLICLRPSAANRALPYAHRLVCNRGRSARAQLRLPAPALAWARVRHWLLPMLQPHRPCPLIREQFAQPSFSRDR